MPNLTVAIIGGGLSGTLTSLQLIQTAKQAITVYLVEQDLARLHRGVAYSSQLPYQPLNVPASAMSLYPDNPDDFYNWLKENQHLYLQHLPYPVKATDFVPRFIFGEYLEARLQQALACVPDQVKLVRVCSTVLALRQLQHNNSFIITLDNEEKILANKVVLALGNFKPANISIPNRAFYNSSYYASDPWSPSALAGLAPEEPVLLIGSSLTMIDLVGSLKAKGHTGKIYVVSRHGFLPQTFALHTKLYLLQHLPTHPGLTALEIFKFVRKEIRKAEAAGYTWYSVLDAMRDHLPAIWQAFSLEEKKRFLRHIRPYWEPHRHRMPLRSAQLLHEMQQQGQLYLFAAHILDLQEKNGTVVATIKRKGSTHFEELQVARVINCTGPQSDFGKIQQPLVQQLLEDGMLVPDELRLGILTTATGLLIDRKNEPVTNLYTLGPPRKSMLYESTALREIRQQAKELARELLPESYLTIKPAAVA